MVSDLEIRKSERERIFKNIFYETKIQKKLIFRLWIFLFSSQKKKIKICSNFGFEALDYYYFYLFISKKKKKKEESKQ